MEDAPSKFFRLAPGREVRLKYAYFIKCEEVVKDEDGNIVELHCTYDPETKSGSGNVTRKVKGTIHWVECTTALQAETRLYDRLFISETPDVAEEGKTFLDNLNPDSLKMVTAFLEPSMKNAKPMDKLQFERTGYFCVDKDSTSEKVSI